MAWLKLFIASLFEICWTYSLKYMDVAKLKKINWPHLFNDKQNAYIIAPFAGYVVFGIGNIFFFSMAMKVLPASTALAVWMGMALVGVKLVGISVFKEDYQLSQFFYIILILIGIVGLKSGTP